MEAGTQERFLDWNRDTRMPVPPPPPLSCDSQFHIYGDISRYPTKKGALYEPPDATFQDMQGVLRKMGFARGVIVHAMPYDTDHRLLIDTLSAIENRTNIRATAIIKEHVTDTELDRLNQLGVRAARFNIGKYYKEEQTPEAMIRSMARARAGLACATACGGAQHSGPHAVAQPSERPDVRRRPHGPRAFRGRRKFPHSSVACRSHQEPRLVADALQRRAPFSAD